MASSEYYIVCKGNQTGPFTPDQIRSQWKSGQLTSDSLIFLQEYNDWVPLIEHIDTFAPQSGYRSFLSALKKYNNRDEATKQDDQRTGCGCLTLILCIILVPLGIAGIWAGIVGYEETYTDGYKYVYEKKGVRDILTGEWISEGRRESRDKVRAVLNAIPGTVTELPITKSRPATPEEMDNMRISGLLFASIPLAVLILFLLGDKVPASTKTWSSLLASVLFVLIICVGLWPEAQKLLSKSTDNPDELSTLPVNSPSELYPANNELESDMSSTTLTHAHQFPRTVVARRDISVTLDYGVMKIRKGKEFTLTGQTNGGLSAKQGSLNFTVTHDDFTEK